jgi:hypothetical protein
MLNDRNTLAMPRKPRAVTRQITRKDLDRVADFLVRLNIAPSAVEVTPGCVRIITAAGDLTAPATGAALARELEEFRASNAKRAA